MDVTTRSCALRSSLGRPVSTATASACQSRGAVRPPQPKMERRNAGRQIQVAEAAMSRIDIANLPLNGMATAHALADLFNEFDVDRDGRIRRGDAAAPIGRGLLHRRWKRADGPNRKTCLRWQS